MKYLVSVNKNSIEIKDKNNKIILYPKKYFFGGKEYEKYVVRIVCTNTFFENVFLSLKSYKEIKVNPLDKKYHFDFSHANSFKNKRKLKDLGFEKHKHIKDLWIK